MSPKFGHVINLTLFQARHFLRSLHSVGPYEGVFVHPVWKCTWGRKQDETELSFNSLFISFIVPVQLSIFFLHEAMLIFYHCIHAVRGRPYSHCFHRMNCVSGKPNSCFNYYMNPTLTHLVLIVYVYIHLYLKSHTHTHLSCQ